jgi:hypothetical protein
MTAAVLNPARRFTAAADAALKGAAAFWLAAALIGQGMFLFYISAFYGPSTLTGNFQAWSRNTNLIKGYVPGDTAGNLAFGAHVLMAAVITFGGTLQLVPQIRVRAPTVHRWIGRLFLTTAMGASLAGLFMLWGRGVTDNLGNALGLSLDAGLILMFGALAWRAAVKRDFASHRRWAMRTFMVANGVWFLRLGFATYGFLKQGLGDALPSMESFFDAWNFGCYLAPLAILELYLRAGDKAGPRRKLAVAGGLVVATALMSIGIVGAWLGFFAPVLAKL